MGILCSWSMDVLVLALSVPILPQPCCCHSGRGGRSQSWAPGCECLRGQDSSTQDGQDSQDGGQATVSFLHEAPCRAVPVGNMCSLSPCMN